MRLSGVPVYAVVNQKNEFVLVTGEEESRQLGLLSSPRKMQRGSSRP